MDKLSLSVTACLFLATLNSVSVCVPLGIVYFWMPFQMLFCGPYKFWLSSFLLLPWIVWQLRRGNSGKLVLAWCNASGDVFGSPLHK